MYQYLRTFIFVVELLLIYTNLELPSRTVRYCYKIRRNKLKMIYIYVIQSLQIIRGRPLKT